MMPDILVLAEQRDGAVKRVSREALAAAAIVAPALGGEVHALVVGPSALDAGELGAHGASRVFHVAEDALSLYQGHTLASLAAERARTGKYALVSLGATALGRDLAPRVAVLLDCPLLTDVTELSHDGGALMVKRPVYSGKAVCTLRVTASPCVVSVRPNVFPEQRSERTASIERLNGVAENPERPRARTVSVKQPERQVLDVAEASVVVSGGRGLKAPENFRLVEELAEVLGAAVGASRAVVDAGWRPHAEQVGQTGKTVSPSLYVAVGISGAIQHLAGMRTSKVIVAINRDKDAPIFKVADYGIVGDLFEIVPRLTEEIKRVKAG